MQIQAINNYSKTNQQTNFKSGYPVIHWVKRAENQVSKEAPTITKELTEELQGKLVRYLNRTWSKSDPQKVDLMGRAFRFLSGKDNSYRSYPIVRSFYNKSAGSQKEGLKPIGYLITGKDVEVFENNFGKPIGRIAAESPVIGGKRTSAELDNAKADYNVGGYKYVKNLAANFRKDGESAELHVCFEPVYKKNGEVKDYILSNMTFRPASQRNINPFEVINK